MRNTGTALLRERHLLKLGETSIRNIHSKRPRLGSETRLMIIICSQVWSVICMQQSGISFFCFGTIVAAWSSNRVKKACISWRVRFSDSEAPGDPNLQKASDRRYRRRVVETRERYSRGARGRTSEWIMSEGSSVTSKVEVQCELRLNLFWQGALGLSKGITECKVRGHLLKN